MNKSTLDDWIAKKINGKNELHNNAIKIFQAELLCRQISYACQNSSFYNYFLKNNGIKKLKLPEGTGVIPLTSPDNIIFDPYQFLCIRPEEVSRIVTIPTSGSSGDSKRIFFSEADLELTVDFFAEGMLNLISPGARVMILMPGDKPASIGDLLEKGLQRIGVQSFQYGPVYDPEDAACYALANNITDMIGIPVQVLAMASSDTGSGLIGRIGSVLLSADYVPFSLAAAVEKKWKCKVFKHYGSTEMGYGGGVECPARSGYHMREADLYFEIVDPVSGIPLKDGEWGEIVFSTLSRQAMPLIRYRTGDMGRFSVAPCPCGSKLSLLEKVAGRYANVLELPCGSLPMSSLDEALFSIPWLLDYHIKAGIKSNVYVWNINYKTTNMGNKDAEVVNNMVMDKLVALPSVQQAINSGMLRVTIGFMETVRDISTGMKKRMIEEIEGE